MKRSHLLIAGFIILLVTEILRVYFVMPFPGSQKSDTIQIAYFLHKYIWWFRILGLLLFVPPMIYIFRNSRWWKKIFLAFFVLLYATVFYAFNFKFLADKMFYQPKNKILATVAANKVDSTKLIIGVVVNGQSKAYPVEISFINSSDAFKSSDEYHCIFKNQNLVYDPRRRTGENKKDPNS